LKKIEESQPQKTQKEEEFAERTKQLNLKITKLKE
jgi:hypothetical protein